MSENTGESRPKKHVSKWTEHYVYLNPSTPDRLRYKGPWVREWTDYSSGVKNPRWKEQVRRGVQAGTSFTGNRRTLTNKPFYINGFYNGHSSLSSKARYGTTVPPNAPGSPSLLDETKANNRALEQHVRKIRSKQTSFQGGVFVGELARSVQLLRNPAQALRQGVDHLHRSTIGRLDRFGRRIKDLPKPSRRELLSWARDTWLEYNLGWAPLLSEVDDGIKTIAESRILEDPTWEPVRSVGVETNINTINPNLTRPTGGYPRFRCVSQELEEVQVRYISCIDVGTYKAYSPRRIGIAPTNWLPTLWELIPYSFVVDYFSNIGDIISAASLAKSSVRWTIKTVRKKTANEYVHWRPEYGTLQAGGVIPGHTSYERRTVTRDPYYGSFVPTLTFNVPGSSTQWLNTAALYDARRELQRWYR